VFSKSLITRHTEWMPQKQNPSSKIKSKPTIAPFNYNCLN
jgi:hypothetical protein